MAYSLEEKRLAIALVYDGPVWKERCSRMPANQVVAIYNNFLKSGKFDNRKKVLAQRVKEQKKGVDYHQITIGEWISSREM